VRTTLGIDLASQPANTAICAIAWDGSRAEVIALARSAWDGGPLDDERLVAAALGVAPLGGPGGWGPAGRPVKVGIDAPFGWPEPFVRAVGAHHRLEPWPSEPDETRRPFERRETDRFVYGQSGKLPLSVSTDRIAYPAMRCAVLLGEIGRRGGRSLVSRDGRGLTAETYPDAALRSWLPDAWTVARGSSYKGDGAAAIARRELLTGALLDALGDGFVLSPPHRAACTASDDCLDALACALVARAADLGQTRLPQPGEQERLAEAEGWIHLPSRPASELLGSA